MQKYKYIKQKSPEFHFFGIKSLFLLFVVKIFKISSHIRNNTMIKLQYIQVVK